MQLRYVAMNAVSTIGPQYQFDRWVSVLDAVRGGDASSQLGQ